MKKILITFALSFIAFYILEHVVAHIFGVELHDLDFGWLGYAGLVLFYGFKYHVLCCLVPFVFTAYKCRHKKCKHEYCDSEKIEHMNTTADKEWSNTTWKIKNFKIGDKVKLSEKAKDGFCITDDRIWTIIDILSDDVEYQIVIEIKGDSQPQFVNKNEIILVD